MRALRHAFPCPRFLHVKWAMARRGRLRIGCSGWDYVDWQGTFYPTEISRAAWLAHYAQQFDTAEINSSFYKLPDATTFRRWRQHVPRGFVFSMKASRFLTHVKRLREPDEPLGRLLGHARALGVTLGPVLYQLPPRWSPDVARLEHFLAQLPRAMTLGPSRRVRARPRVHRLRHAIEFRDPRWYHPDVFALLAAHRVALCVHDLAGAVSPRERIGPFTYVRLHGPVARYAGSYSGSALADWAAWLGEDVKAGRDVFVYFNNTADGSAPRNALELRALMQGG
jgi:uncharacterized protein YecE (DUF72 family)